MIDRSKALAFRWLPVLACSLVFAAAMVASAERDAKAQPANPAAEFATHVRPLIARHCLQCHSTKKHKGDLDLERFTALDMVQKDVRPWQGVLEMLESSQMPPRGNPQPSQEERRRMVAWVRGMLAVEARAHAGDPGRVVMRRLTNAEYNNTIRDLTGLDLQPARDFPVDGAAGEGFTNAGDALVISPALLGKYLKAAKDIAAHAVLLPDGFRFSPTRTRRDWTDEVLTELRQFYAAYTADGRLPLRAYMSALLRHRAELAGGRSDLETIAAREKLNAKYLQILWHALNDGEPSFPLDVIRARWRSATAPDLDALVADITAWEAELFRFVPIGSYRYGNTIRQLANDPPLVTQQTLRVKLKPSPGQNDVVLHLAARDLSIEGAAGHVTWERPRFEGNGAPLLLRDYAQYGAQFEIDFRGVFAASGQYLAAAVEAAQEPKLTPQAIASKHGLDPVLMKRWVDLLNLQSSGRGTLETWESLKKTPAVPLKLLDTPLPRNAAHPAINGWTVAGADLPVLIANASGTTEHVPGRVSPHQVAVHPDPTRFVAAVWKSPLDGPVRVGAKIVHAHPACGNGVTWWLEYRREGQSAVLADGNLDVGRGVDVPSRELKVGRGDEIVLAVDPRDGNISCDLTEINLNVTEIGNHGRAWDLAHDVADTILKGNPHADKLGNADTWRFARGPARRPGQPLLSGAVIPVGSVLARWRAAVADARRPTELSRLAMDVQSLLTGNQPPQKDVPDRVLFDNLVSLDGPLLQGIDLAHLRGARPGGSNRYGLDGEHFGGHSPRPPNDAASMIAPSTSVISVRLPAAIFRDHDFVVDVKLAARDAKRVVQCRVSAAPPRLDGPIDTKAPCLVSSSGAGRRQLLDGLEEFRRIFPTFICFQRVIPDDEVVCLKLYHREDDPLIRLFLDDAAAGKLNRLWSELRFISQWPVTEHKQLPLFIGFVTQDQPKELLAYFESQREPFRKRAEAFEKERDEARRRHLEALVRFAARAYRRPLLAHEKEELMHLYSTLQKKGMAHEEAVSTLLTRVFISPSFLYRVERTPAGGNAQRVSDWELASRLSYTLWATMPDDELRVAAATGHLHEPPVLSAQVARMLKDAKVRGLAVEFATQWLHVRDIQQNKEKNEKLFPTFDDKLRQVLFEESVRFFQYLLQNDRPLSDILDADYTFLNETLAKHYGIPGVVGSEWRRVDGVKKYGRGGVLALGSVLTQQAGASRTSPVLRGNWLLEVMLGEKLPKPPPNVPRLPEDETTSAGTVREIVEKHVRAAECAVCHQRIDPFGFALEKYDPIGRYRDTDLAGRPIDVRVRLKDGTQFQGIEGLRDYLLKQRRGEVERHFCQKLLGYTLGRSVMLSDQPLLDEMLDNLKRNDYRLSVAVLTIVRSQQFRYHRGLEATKDE